MKQVAFCEKGREVIKIMDISTGDIVTRLDDPHAVKILRFSPCGNFLACACENGDIVIWSCESWTVLHTLSGIHDSIEVMHFNNSGERLLAMFRSQFISVWSTSTGALELHFDVLRYQDKERGLEWAHGCFDHGNQHIAISGGPIFCIYDSITGAPQKEFRGKEGTFLSMQYSNDDKTLICGEAQVIATVWDVESGTLLMTMPRFPDTIWNSQLNYSTTLMLCCGWNEKEQIWDLTTFQKIAELDLASQSMWCACFSEDEAGNSEHVITGQEDGSIKVFDTMSGQQLSVFQASDKEIVSIACQPYQGGSYI